MKIQKKIFFWGVGGGGRGGQGGCERRIEVFGKIHKKIAGGGSVAEGVRWRSGWWGSGWTQCWG